MTKKDIAKEILTALIECDDDSRLEVLLPVITKIQQEVIERCAAYIEEI